MSQRILPLALIALLLAGCSTDFDLVGEYQDRAVVYALLDPNDNPANGGDGHLFRVQKMFLGQASAFDMAMVPDSSYFNPDKVTVNLVEFGDNNTLRFPMDTITIDNKETGGQNDGQLTFFAPRQRLYRSDRNIDPTKEYGLEVIKKDLATQDTVYSADARIRIVNAATFGFQNPNVGNNNPSPKLMDLYITSSGIYRDYTVMVRTAQNARMYEVWLRFHYREVVNGVSTPKSIEWVAGTFENQGGAGSQAVQVGLSGESIISRIGSSLPRDPNITRIIGIPHEFPSQASVTRDMDVFVRMGGQQLFEFIEINSASNTGAIQDRPVYTNINNGLGLLSSRTSVLFGPGLYLSNATRLNLVNGSYTTGLNFVIED